MPMDSLARAAVLLGLICLLFAGCSRTPLQEVLPAVTSPAPGADVPVVLTTRTVAHETATTAPPVPSATTAHTATQTRTPTSSSTPTTLACWQTGGRYERDSLRDSRLPLPLEYSVYIPPCYTEQPKRRYPVLYLIHGQNYNHDQWDRLGLDEQADRLIRQGEIPPFIVVLPRDRSWAQPSEDLFGQVLVEKLVVQIDATYRTIPERSFRAIGGLSRGAGWAVHLGLSRWDLFGSIGAHSLPVFWEDTVHIRSWLAVIPPDQMPRIYLDIGDRDRPQILHSAQWFETVLNEMGVPHEWYLFSGYHEEDYWKSHLPGYLLWYTAEWNRLN